MTFISNGSFIQKLKHLFFVWRLLQRLILSISPVPQVQNWFNSYGLITGRFSGSSGSDIGPIPCPTDSDNHGFYTQVHVIQWLNTLFVLCCRPKSCLSSIFQITQQWLPNKPVFITNPEHKLKMTIDYTFLAAASASIQTSPTCLYNFSVFCFVLHSTFHHFNPSIEVSWQPWHTRVCLCQKFNVTSITVTTIKCLLFF